MCGICGFANEGNEALLKAMAASLAHRGPDEDGFFIDPGRVGLGVRRLRVIDPAGGAQPISGEDGSVRVVFNGEIYNFRELRAGLEKSGHVFRTRSDTEVLVHLYEEHGDAFPKLLRGMFAFALWDSKARKLLLGRDQFGIKPLYYALSGDRLYFASELKALRLVSGLCGELDPEALDLYFTRLCIPAPLTAYKGVLKLEPASVLSFSGGSVRVERYWRLEAEAGPERPDGYYAERIRELLSASVREQLVSDVPLGLLLSGGVDSASLLAFMTEHAGRGVKTFTAGFGDGAADFDETDRARAAAAHFGAEHFGIPVKPDLSETITELAGLFDEPFADSSAIAGYLVAKEARRRVTVALTGIGGDELFAGYPRHLGARLLPWYLKLPSTLRSAAGRAAALLPESRSPSNTAGRAKRFLSAGGGDFGSAYDSWLSYLGDGEKKDLYSASLLSALPRGGAVRGGLPLGPDGVFEYELGTYLPDDLLCLADRTSMANSLELRVPFLDTRLVEFMAGVPLAAKTRGFRLKHLLKKAMAGRLPPGALEGPKRGFQVPLARWQEKELKAFTAAALGRESVLRAGALSPEGVERTLSEHASGRRNLYDRIHAAAVFHLWFEHQRRHPAAAIGGAWNVRGSRRILLVNMAGLGDIIMMTPAVRAIKEAYPEAVLELLTIDRSADLAAGIPGIDRVRSVPIRYRAFGPVSAFKFVRELLRLRAERFDALVNFSLVSSFAGLLKARFINLMVKPGLSSCRALKGFGPAGDRTSFEDLVESKSEVALTAELLAPLGLKPRDLEIRYVPGAAEESRVRRDLAERGISGKPLIGLNPGAFRPSRRWPPEKWKALVRLLLERHPGAAVIVTGSPSERDLAEELMISDRVFSAAGIYSVRESAALYRMLDVFITNDTGPMHMAAAAGTRTVCVFGPGDHARFAPSVPEDRRRVVRNPSAGCAVPCYEFDCPVPACLESVSPEQVISAAEELLSK